MIRLLSPLAAALLITGAAPPAPKAPSEIVAAAPAAAWRAIDPDDLLVMDLASGARVTIQLAPQFAPVHVANIRALVRGGWFDGNAVVRVQDGLRRTMGRGRPCAAAASRARPLRSGRV